MENNDIGQQTIRVMQIRDRVLRKGVSSDEALEVCSMYLDLANKYSDLLKSNRTRLKLISNFMDMKK